MFPEHSCFLSPSAGCFNFSVRFSCLWAQLKACMLHLVGAALGIEVEQKTKQLKAGEEGGMSGQEGERLSRQTGINLATTSSKIMQG